MSASVVQIDTWREDQTSFGNPAPAARIVGLPEPQPIFISRVIDAIRTEARSEQLNISQLYYELSGDSRLLKAIGTIEQARLCLLSALNGDPTANFVSFDQELMTARSFLLNAFRYREIGDGYAALINAAIWAISNRGQEVLSRRQINVLIGALDRLAKGPLLHFDSAMLVLDEMEEADLEIEPRTLDILTDDLDD